MGIRFRKRIKLAPGIRMNFSRSGVSWTLGPKGASIGVGRRGSYLNTGIPGTGLYSRNKIGGSQNRNTETHVIHSEGQNRYTEIPANQGRIPITIGLTHDGTIAFHDNNGNPLSENLINLAKMQQGDVIKGLIQKKCDEINEHIESVGEIHQFTPNPNEKPTYEQRQYQQVKPIMPILKNHGIMSSIFSSIGEKIDQENQQIINQYDEALAKWNKDKTDHEESELRRKELIEKGIYNDTKAMEEFLEENLQNIVWPQETNISTVILDNGKCVFIDVDLPEEEDMPNKIASYPNRGYKLYIKDMPKQQINKLYMRHIHGIGFRIIGEVFASLPVAEEVVLSAYSQRVNSATGQTGDEYLYSVRVKRESWGVINFDNLSHLDVVEALSQFELRREMTKTGIFKPIIPFTPK